MADQRHARRVGHSIVLAVPARVREHLGLEAGAPVYFHLVRGQEVVISMTPIRAGGRPEGLRLQHLLEQEQALTARLRQRVQTRDLTTLNEGMNAGYMLALKHGMSLATDLATIKSGLVAIYQQLAPPRAESGDDATMPLPFAPPSAPDSSAGEAVTPGAEPPGHP